MKSISIVVFRIVVLTGLLGWPGQVTAATNKVTVAFTRVVEIDCNDGVLACPNDYYPKADIDAQGLNDGKSDFCCAHDTDFKPDWVFSADVDTTHTPFPVHLELWDEDSLSDDQIDIGEGASQVVDMLVNLKTCTWSIGSRGGTLNSQGQSAGSGSDSAQVYFMITTDAPACQDSDKDGLLDGWETTGFDANADGLIDVDLPAMGANPRRRDLFLEVDYLVAPGSHTHAPLQAAIQQVVQAFANAPVPNPDGTTGVQLHVDVGPLYGALVVTKVAGTGGVTGTFGDHGGGNQIPEAGNTIVDYDGADGNPATGFFTLKAMNPDRDSIFRYVMFAHQTNARLAVNDCTSGVAKGIPGVNFIVSLGGVGLRQVTPPPAPQVLAPCWGVDAGGQSVGSQAQQAGTLMHEFGHTLGLRHGGNDDINNKPNYLSVMSYQSFLTPGSAGINEQACNVPAIPALGIPGGCDYSRVALPPGGGLNENALDECVGIGLGANDFNNNGRLEGASNCQPPNNANVPFNINRDTSADANNNGIQDPAEPPLIGTLNGFQDWGSLTYAFQGIFDFTTAGTPTDQEPNPQTIEASRNALTQMMQPRLKITTTGPADAIPGDAVAYNVRLENRLEDASRGPAVNVLITDTKPDSATETLTIGTVVLRAVINSGINSRISCSIPDGTVLTNAARARGTDLLNNPIDLSSSTSTLIHTPVVTIATSATAAVNAGEAIAYSIQYENTGSANALNVVVTSILPKEVYYSQALDQGIGPKPSSFTVNGDGTRTLVWTIGSLPAHSGAHVIHFTARPTLLALGATVFTQNVRLTFMKSAACPADPALASAATTITVVALNPKNGPHIHLHWKKHAAEETEEIRARIQATDQRFDGRAGAAADGTLTAPEVKAAFNHRNIWQYLFHLNRPIHLEHDLLALYFNLATRRVNADTPVEQDHKTPAGLATVRDAGLNAQATLLIPYSEATEERYHAAKEVVEKINH